jgi:hypothetical protein
MKWTEAQIVELKKMCFKGVSNTELAKHFNADIREIYTMRSREGITIPKVREMLIKEAELHRCRSLQ